MLLNHTLLVGAGKRTPEKATGRYGFMIRNDRPPRVSALQ